MPYEWELPAFCDIYINAIGNIHLKSSLIKRSLLFPYYKGNTINMAMMYTLYDTQGRQEGGGAKGAICPGPPAKGGPHIKRE